MVDKIKVKLSTWKCVFLSLMGRVHLIKSMINGIMVYSFHIYRWPFKLLNMLDCRIKNFVLGGDIYYIKVCTVTWKNVCLLWDSRGLDLKPTRLINDFLLLHLSWNLLNQEF